MSIPCGMRVWSRRGTRLRPSFRGRMMCAKESTGKGFLSGMDRVIVHQS